MFIIIYLLAGALAGLLSGMFGIGGGLVMVPVLLTCFEVMGVAPSIAMHLALGSSLATIIVTCSVSAYTHHQSVGLEFGILWRLASGLLFGALVGGVLAASLNAEHLKGLFSAFLVGVALYMLVGRVPKGRAKGRLSTRLLALSGAVTGALATLFGVAGGLLITPLLTALGVTLKKAVALSAACGVVVAITGSLSYMHSGWNEQALPQWSLGYVYLPACISMALMSPWFVKIGARLTHSMDPQRLKQAFACLLLLTVVRLLA